MASVKTKSRAERGIALLLLSFVLVTIGEANTLYEIPQPKFKLLKPKGFQVSIPDEHGIQLFAFHGNLNKKMEKMANGQFSMDIIEKQNGKWIYQNRKLKMRSGDVIYFWVFVIKNGIGYRLDDGVFEVSDSDMKYTSKKIHKLRKRYVNTLGYRPFYTSGFPFPSHQSASLDEDSNENPVGYGFGHGFPHHHPGRGQHNFRGPHTPEYHGGSFGFHDNGHHGHHGHHSDFHHGHHNVHKHNGHNPRPYKHEHDCEWSDSSDENSDELPSEKTFQEDRTTTTTTRKPVVNPVTTTKTRKPVVNPVTTIKTTTSTTTMMTPEPEAEMIETTTEYLPLIDPRFGEK